MDPEFADDGLAWDLGLELFGDFAFDESPLAVGASGGEVGVMAFADLFRRRRWAMAVRAVSVAGFTTGSFGIGFGGPFAEGSGLSFAGA
jgi:hypothetical protein